MPMPYAALKILRVFRLLRIFRYMKSFRILGDAISSKKHELTVSLAFLTILTVILSFFLYFAEHAAQPELCENGWKTMVWAFAKYLGDPGKIADYPLVTAWGNVLAIIVGILGIAIFAVPAGLIGSGFTEVMEAERDAKALKDNAESINEFMLLKSIKREGIFWPAKNVSLGNLKLEIGLTEEEIVKSVAASKGLRIKNLSDAISEGPKTDMLVVNQFVVNTEYGCHIDRNSSVTIVNPIGKADNGLSFFDWHIAQLGGFNYVANEFYSRQNGLDKEKRFNFYTVVEETKNNSVFQQFIDAITSDRSENDWIIVIAGEQVVKNITDFHFEFGGEKGETSFDFEECITHDKKLLKQLFDDFSNTLSEKAQLTTDAHQVQPKLNKDNIARYIKTRTNANVLLITVSYKLMVFKKEMYSAIYNIADVLNRNLETKKIKGLHTEEYNVRPSESNYWRELYGLPKMEESK
jgi:voltage-gated potassium channel